MTPSLDPGIQSRIESPTSDEEVRVLIGVGEVSEAVRERIQSIGGEINLELPPDHYSISIRENSLEELASLSFVKSIELDTQGEELESDFLYPDGSGV